MDGFNNQNQNNQYSQQPTGAPYGQQPYTQQPYGQPAGTPYGQPVPPQPNKGGNATAILVLGILSIVCCAPCGIVSLIMYLSNKDNIAVNEQGKAKGGFICSIIGLALWVIGIIVAATSGSF